MENNFNFSAEAVKAIEGLRHTSGTFDYYNNTITRLFTYVLHYADEIGMDEYEAISTLRALDALRSDIEAIAGNRTADKIDDRTEIRIKERHSYDPVRTLLVRAFSATMEANEAANDALNIAENNTDIVPADTEVVKEAITKVNAAVDYLADILGMNAKKRPGKENLASTY